MSRPTHIQINEAALLNNLKRVESYAPQAKIIAMVKANAYGHGIKQVASILQHKVAAFGVACIEEAMTIRRLGINTAIILMEGIFEPTELSLIAKYNFEIIVHNQQQLQILLQQRFSQPLKVWIKIDTGMHRLGFAPHEVAQVYAQLKQCAWVEENLGLMSHFSCADELTKQTTVNQLYCFEQTIGQLPASCQSLANSAAIIAYPQTHKDFVRPGIMLYGISPFADKHGKDFGLEAVMSLHSKIIAIKPCQTNDAIGYGGIWRCPKPSVIGVVAIGYGDGYPRHMSAGAPVLVNGQRVPLVGRVSMDMLTIDITDDPAIEIGTTVELWGKNLAIEEIAHWAGTSPYELICQISDRVR